MRSERWKRRQSDAGPGEFADMVEPELDSLAARLRADARQLSEAYPPQENCPKRHRLTGDFGQSVPGRRRRWSAAPPSRVWLMVGLALSLVVGLALCWRTPRTTRRDRGVEIGAAAAEPAKPSPPLSTNATRLSSGDNSGANVEDRPPIISPVMFVSELSDPELEAWLDLQRERRLERIEF